MMGRRFCWRHPKFKECLMKLMKIFVLFIILVLIFVPIRNVIFQFFLPGMWLEHSTLFIIKVVLDNQQFPVADTSLGQSPIKLQVNFDDIKTKFTPQYKTYAAFYERLLLLQEVSKTDPYAQTRLAELINFKPLMSEYDRAVALFTVDTFVKACEAANLTYFLISGSVLGAVRHHGIIPWDDDIDIIMNSSDWHKIRNVLGNIEGFELFAPSRVQWKFFMSSLPPGNRPFKWPNIDLFFFNEDETHIWAQTWGAKSSLCSKKSDIFPLRRRKFEMFYLPVPKASKSLAEAEFGEFSSACKTANYVHKTNVAYSASSTIDLKCQQLHEVFPFVFQEKGQQGTVLEVRKLAGKSLDNFTLPDDV
ncbi:fukutin-related protein [Biomphalaria pfeifferi]|uniref:Fukutin-related protein n=1 Tax=Biomphalaria pfeifferi TaxID=112525 RepID=A0AAD8CC83_BIOPF|nr:fukutin-related protein [Biomphalaria pfeifferi]